MDSSDLVESACRTADFRVIHIGCRGNRMLVVFQRIDSQHPNYVVELHGLNRFFCRDVFGNEPIRVFCNNGVGSFGFDLARNDRGQYREFYINLKNDPHKNVFRAIVEKVIQREAVGNEDQNYPG